jgi:putative endonuclease
MMVVTVYVIRGTTSGRRYIGITNDLPRRLREHGSKSTKAGQLLGDFELIYRESFPDHSSARKRERFLKSGQGRKWLGDLQRRSGPAGGG